MKESVINKQAGKNFLKMFALAAMMCGNAYAAPVTNRDVILLLDSGMAEDVVIQAIKSGQPKFDTSASALIKLKNKGATPAILKAMMSNNKKTASEARAGEQSDTSSGLNPEEVILVLDGKETSMQYIVPSMRTAMRALGFGGMATYSVLQGDKAQLRLSAAKPEFIVSVPKNAQANNYLTLAHFAVRNNQSREVSTGGGYMSYSSGINRDRVVAIASEKLADQSRAKDGFILYTVKPEQPLPSGEYALVLYTSEVHMAGFFSQAGNSYFDFGVN